MKIKQLFSTCILALSLGVSGLAVAEDIDLFMDPATPSGDLPQVLFLIDNSANWNATINDPDLGSVDKMELIHRALYELLTDDKLTHTVTVDPVTGEETATSTEVDKVEVGLGMFAKSNNPKGGKIFAAMNTLDVSAQDAWKCRLYDVDATSGACDEIAGNELLPKTNNAPYALMMHEALLYYRGGTPNAGLADGIYDPGPPASAIDLDGADPDAFDNSDNYVSPVTPGSCSKKYIVLIANGEPDSGENNEAEAKLAALGGDTTAVPIDTYDNFQSNMADEYARYMADIDGDDIHTFVVDLHEAVANPDTQPLKWKAARKWMHSIGFEGQGETGGGYYEATSLDELKAAFTKILNRLQATNSVFAASSLPISVNVRGTNVNQVYMGVFRPDDQAQPRWWGNLKLYQLAVNGGTIFLADKNGDAVQDTTNGFMLPDVTSFWTTSSTFWNYKYGAAGESDAPDGDLVEKGGGAQKLRENWASRNLYTCTSSCASGDLLSDTPFSTSNPDISSDMSAATLGAADDTERDAIINWVIGEDNKVVEQVAGIDYSEDGDTDFTDVRPSIHGDVLHSRPAIVNYNTNSDYTSTPKVLDDNDVVVFYGSDDGVFHAVRGGMDSTDTNTGKELWGFVPDEFFGDLKRLRDNDPLIWTRQVTTNPRRDYFVDGAVTVLQKDNNNDGALKPDNGAEAADEVYVFLSMRRGGRFLYALDVSDRNAPKLLWKKDYTDTGYGELGQTWSAPSPAKIYAKDGPSGTVMARDVLIMGAGYDAAAEDADPATTDTMGRGIMVIDAMTGDVIWQVGPSPSGAAYNDTESSMTHSIPSDVIALNADGDANGYVDRLYVGDTGGNVWRADIGDSNPNQWSVNKIAELGSDATGATAADARKFLYPPDVVYGDTYDAVMIGSGDRENPFSTSVTDRFYMFKDAGSGYPLVTSDLTDATDPTTTVDLTTSDGWYITLGTGEKNVGGVVTLDSYSYFNTNMPDPGANVCGSDLGIARSYVVNYLDGSPFVGNDRYDTVPGGGLPPTPVPVVVELTDENGNTQKYEVVVSGTDVHTGTPNALDKRFRNYWYKEME
jgi:type IV pilus assembly protein PilY1